MRFLTLFQFTLVSKDHVQVWRKNQPKRKGARGGSREEARFSKVEKLGVGVPGCREGAYMHI